MLPAPRTSFDAYRWAKFLIDFNVQDESDDDVEAVKEVMDETPLHVHILISQFVLTLVKRSYGDSVVATCGLFSGGKDSTTFMHLLKDHFDYAVHVNTGIGVEETRQFVRDTCELWGLTLIEKSPPPGSTYEEQIEEFGFPGPAAHGRMYINLKERALRLVRKDLVSNGRKQRVLFVNGVRHFESTRRMRNTQMHYREGSVVWLAPIAWWPDRCLAEYRERFDVPRNEVSDHLHMSGECLCGAYAKEGEFDQLAFFYPATAERIRSLERRLEAQGNPACRWGRPPPKGFSRMSAIDSEPATIGPLCQKCEIGVEELEV
jgi:3'-phosphoadenosine 5'-phosphosulfate sulfotransferase (PAPS reductase)/FAD synthetase